MRNFFLFIRRFFNLLLFIALEVLCAVLISHTRTVQGDTIVNSSNAIVGFIDKKQNDLLYYVNLGTINDSLQHENARLHALIAAKGYSTDLLRDSTVTLKTGIGDSLHPVQYARYTFREARVINNSVAAENNFITLNRGSNDGIAKDMPVISGSGVVGRVVNVSAHFATVRSVLSEQQPVSAKLKDGTAYVVKWGYEKRLRKPDVLYMAEVDPSLKLHIGDSVFTTSYSFFPEDVMVGTVTYVEIVKKTGKRLLSIRPASNFRNLHYVYVIGNPMAAEQKELEKQNTPAAEKAGKKTGSKKR